MSQWLRIFEHEIARRRRISNENRDLFLKIHLVNPKGLLEKDKCSKHVWVPATHVMIHDNGARSHNISGIKRRAFSEALSYKSDDAQIIPQVCWRCDAVREFSIKLMSTDEREAQLKSQRPRRKRKRTVEPIEQVDFGDLF